MSIQEALANYHNSLYYNQEWHRLAIKGDIDSIVNIGTDFARSEMMDYAVACWQHVIDNGHGTAEAYSNLGVSYYYGNGVYQDYKKAVQYYQMAAEHGVNMAIDALIRLGLYSETRDFAIYPRSVDNYSCYDSLDELHLDGISDGETF